jgi:8-oxo-dGTP pyrophosphatase MutT (NUDIX family)
VPDSIQTTMQDYVCGFMFNESLDDRHVLLIEKQTPAWQKGFFNGIGGKIEPTESPLSAMQREFREECGLEVRDFEEIFRLTGTNFRVFFFRAFGDITGAQSLTVEKVTAFPINQLPNVISNLRWIIPLLLDEMVCIHAEVVDSSVRPSRNNLYQLLKRVLKDEEFIIKWCDTPNLVLGGKTPHQIWESDDQTPIIDMVGRYEHGIFT